MKRQTMSTRAGRAARRNQIAEESDEDSSSQNKECFLFDGKVFESYSAMVAAKRQRNYIRLEQSGLLKAAEDLRNSSSLPASQRGLKSAKNSQKRNRSTSAPSERRKSKRLAGAQADGIYVEEERRGKFIVANKGPPSNTIISGTGTYQDRDAYRQRVNDGAALTVADAVNLCGDKWSAEFAVDAAQTFVAEKMPSLVRSPSGKRNGSPSSVATSSLLKNSIHTKLEQLAIEDPKNVAKVTPDRIFSISCHPSSDSLLVSAGDKQGFVGLWDVDATSSDATVHLFKVHARPICCLEWSPSGSSLLSASYDGTARWFDVESQQFTQVFAMHGSSEESNDPDQLGLIDEHCSRNQWMQFCTFDPRFNPEKCFFASFSSGFVAHIDLRARKKVSFHEKLSEKKINSLSLHTNGNILASAGLDSSIKIWDVRMTAIRKSAKPVAEHKSSKSINSAFYSPSGKFLVSTTMSDRLEIFDTSASGALKVVNSIRHNNCTGRWLSTFMARWHPSLDIFVVGSMQKPRTIEVFDGSDGSIVHSYRGDPLSAVASRCCFHPDADKVVVVGGNSSGRVSVVR